MSSTDIPMGPTDGQIAVVPVTNSSVHHDLTVTAYDAVSKAIRMGRPLTIIADGADVFYRWSPQKSGGTVDEAQNASGGTPANQCSTVFAGECRERFAPKGTKGIIVKTPNAGGCKLRIEVTG